MIKLTFRQKLSLRLHNFLFKDIGKIKFDLFKEQYKEQLIIGQNLQFEEFTTFNFLSAEGKIILKDNIYFRKYCSLMVYKKGILKIDDNVFFNNYCSINCLENITIGQNTLFGEGVKIYDHNHAITRGSEGGLLVMKDDFTYGPIVIGSNCWIGSNVTILKGVTIGDNVIIGANNLIYKSIQPNSILKADSSFTLS